MALVELGGLQDGAGVAWDMVAVGILGFGDRFSFDKVGKIVLKGDGLPARLFPKRGIGNIGP